MPEEKAGAWLPSREAKAVSEPTESECQRSSGGHQTGEALGRTKRSTKEGGDVRNLGCVFPDGFRVRNDAAPRDGVVVRVATGTTAATSTTAALTALATLLLAGLAPGRSRRRAADHGACRLRQRSPTSDPEGSWPTAADGGRRWC